MRELRQKALPTLHVATFCDGQHLVTQTFSGRHFIVGRDTTLADVVIVSPKISREHALIEHDGHNVFISDLRSRHGTWLQGDRIIRTVLQPHDAVSLGSHHLHIWLSRPASGSSDGIDRRRPRVLGAKPQDALLSALLAQPYPAASVAAQLMILRVCAGRMVSYETWGLRRRVRLPISTHGVRRRQGDPYWPVTPTIQRAPNGSLRAQLAPHVVWQMSRQAQTVEAADARRQGWANSANARLNLTLPSDSILSIKTNEGLMHIRAIAPVEHFSPHRSASRAFKAAAQTMHIAAGAIAASLFLYLWAQAAPPSAAVRSSLSLRLSSVTQTNHLPDAILQTTLSSALATATQSTPPPHNDMSDGLSALRVLGLLPPALGTNLTVPPVKTAMRIDPLAAWLRQLPR